MALIKTFKSSEIIELIDSENKALKKTKKLLKKLKQEKFDVRIQPMSEKIGFLYALKQTK